VTRSNRRPLLAGAVAASAALATGLLAACSAGQVAQTAGIEPAVPGVSGQTAGYPVYVRNALLEYSEPKGYPSGAKVPMALWIFNNSHEPVTLVSVTAAQGDRPVQVVLSSGSSVAPSASNAPACSVPVSASPVPSPTTTTPSASPSASGSAKPSGSASASASASPSASPSPSAAGATTIKVSIPAGGCVELSKRATQYLQAVDLPGALGNADPLAVTFGFTTAGGQSLSTGTPLNLPVAPPANPGPRPSITE